MTHWVYIVIVVLSAVFAVGMTGLFALRFGTGGRADMGIGEDYD